MDGQNTILSVVGPMATTARSLTLLFKGVLSQEPWLHDPFVVELPWRCDVENEVQGMIERSRGGSSELAFGIMHHDGLVRPHPPVERAMRMVERTLKRLGHKVGYGHICGSGLTLGRSSSGILLLTALQWT